MNCIKFVQSLVFDWDSEAFRLECDRPVVVTFPNDFDWIIPFNILSGILFPPLSKRRQTFGVSFDFHSLISKTNELILTYKKKFVKGLDKKHLRTVDFCWFWNEG